jgi:hypothetical protein
MQDTERLVTEEIEMLKIVLNWQSRVWYTDKRKEEGKGLI